VVKTSPLSAQPVTIRGYLQTNPEEEQMFSATPSVPSNTFHDWSSCISTHRKRRHEENMQKPKEGSLSPLHMRHQAFFVKGRHWGMALSYRII
jgi:hypothetical protein